MTTASMVFRGDARSLEASATSGAAAVGRVEKSAKGVGPAFKGANREVESFGKSIKHIATLTLGTLGAAELVKGIKDSINAAGDLEKQQRKVLRVFGDTPKVLEAFEKSSAKSYGVSHLAALKAVTSTGALLTNLGIGSKVAAGMSVGIVKLSSDIASFNGLPTATVADRVNKALLGQTRGLKSLGIALSQADVNAKAFSLGLVKPVKSADAIRAAQDRVTVSTQKYGLAVRDHGKASKEALAAEAALIKSDASLDKARSGSIPKLTAQQQAVATLALIYERSKKQQGDFGRNSDTLANQQKTLDATFADLSDRLGEDLTPAMKTLVEFMAGPGITAAGHFLTTVETDSRKVYNAVKPLAPAAHAAADGLSAIANADGVIPTLIGTTAAYKGVSLALKGGQSAYASAAGAIANLASPFRTVAGEAKASSTAIAAFGAEAVAADAEVAAAETGFLGLANPIAAIAVVTAAAIGGLILLSTTSESAGEKARKAARDFQSLVDAENKIGAGKLDITQAKLDVSTSRSALQQFAPVLQRARATAAQDFPSTAKGARDEKVAHDALGRAIDHEKQLYIDLARSKARVTDATSDLVKRHKDEKKASEDVAGSVADLGKKYLDGSTHAIAFGRAGGRIVTDNAKVIGAQEQLAGSFDDIANAAKGTKPNVEAAARIVSTFIKTADHMPTKKELAIFLHDTATGNLKALHRLLDTITSKTITLTTNEITHPFSQHNPVDPTKPPKASATGSFIDRPTLSILGEEAPAHPEFVIPTNPARRGRALGLISQMRSWIPGFADGTGPSARVAAQERSAVANTPAKTTKSSKSSRSTKAKDNRPAWLKAFEDGGNKLPGDDAFSNAIARAQADLDDAGRTAPKADDIAALHHLIRLANRRLPTLHALRGTHKEAVWQTAVNTQISSVGGQLTGYRSSLADLLHKPSPDEIQIAIPGGIQWAIERAGFTESPADDIAAQKRKAAWLRGQISKTPAGAKRTALKRELARTSAELSSLKADQTQAAKDASDAAAQAAETPPDVPVSIQEALADAALTPDTGDDLAALQAEQTFLQQAIAAETNPTARVALKEALAGVNDQIAGLTSTDSSTSGNTGPTADDQAILSQTQARLATATRSAALSEAEVRAFGSPGDIGTGRSATAFDAARGAPQLYWGAPASTTQVASAAAQGFGNQPAVQSIRQRIAI